MNSKKTQILNNINKLLTIDDIPEDVCDRRAAESGMIIVWLFIMGLIYFIIGMLIYYLRN